jgi:hypothetical protein
LLRFVKENENYHCTARVSTILQNFLWHGFLNYFEKRHMEDKDKKVIRNRPAEDGRRNDPDLRDESAAQPGASTISNSATDEENEHLTKTAGDSFRANKPDRNADKKFDDNTGSGDE